MSVMIIHIVVSLIIALAFLGAFIWAIKTNQYDDDYSPSVRILFASDLSELDGSSLPEVFMDIARVNKAEITILTVNKEHDIIDVEKAEVGYDLHSQMQELNHRFEVIESENIELGIEEYARVNDMQMLVTIPKQSTWFHRLVNPSLSKKLAQHIDIPMLALSK